MHEAALPFEGPGALPALKDFQLGALSVSPSRRFIEGVSGSAHLQPQAMAVFLYLAARQGAVVSRRDLFMHCWGGAPVGDDSVNQAISAIRQALARAAANDMRIETVPRTGYRLVCTHSAARPEPDATEPFVRQAYDCWRLGWPGVDVDEISALEQHLDKSPADSEAWGMLALLLRKAAEYARASDCAAFVQRCEQAARQALERNPVEPNARVALAGLTPLFGNWSMIRGELGAVLEDWPDHAPALHDLLFLEMATGRPSISFPMLERLLAHDRFAATYYYKAMYQLWALGRVSEAEQLALHAMALWPRHPATWLAWYWILVGTRRGVQALRLIGDEECRPAFPAATLQLLGETAQVIAGEQSGASAGKQRAQTIAAALELASFGPATAIASLQALCVLDAIDEAFEVAYGYYLGRGTAAIPLRWNASDPSVTDQHRRLTQLLFIPLSSGMRADPRFEALCADIGLSAYWRENQIVPDFRK